MRELILKNKNQIILQAGLILTAVIFYSQTIQQYPLVDSDEATYALMTNNMIEQHEYLSIPWNGAYYFEKPPLYFWLAIGSVKIFGPQEFAFRLPSVLCAIMSLWLVYLIVKRLTQNSPPASAAFLILLFSPPFFEFNREARLDPGVVFGILLALYFTIRGWKKRHSLLGVFPAIAIAIMFKSMIAFLAFPVILIFSLVYRQYLWLKDKFLWFGLGLGIVVAAPWHIAQGMRFGRAFWDGYLFNTFFQRALGTVVGSADKLLYLKILLQYYIPWFYLAGFLALIIIAEKIWKRSYVRIDPLLPASFFSGTLIILGLSLFQTHLSTYILPAFPFLAMFVALAFFWQLSLMKVGVAVAYVFFVPLLAFGAVYSFKAVSIINSRIPVEEKEAGLALKNENSTGKVYIVDWPLLETLHYYGGRNLTVLSKSEEGQVIKAPFDIITSYQAATYFVDGRGNPVPGFASMELLYRGQVLFLWHSDQDIVLPKFTRK